MMKAHSDPGFTLLISVLARIMTSTSCARAQRYDIMSAPGKCDTVPLPLRPGEQIGGVMPASRPPGSDSILVIGTVVEATTGRALERGTVALFENSAPTDLQRPMAIASTNATAGFVLVAPRPGSYEVVMRRIGYRRKAQPVELRPGIVDTLRLVLQYEHCVGY